MCRPDHYGIRYEINPWMRTSRGADPARAMAQWQELYDTLTRRLGAQVELIEPDKDWPDMVFTANAGLVVGGKFIVSNFRYPQREGEACLFWKWFTDRRYTCIALPLDHFFEGEGDALWAGPPVLAAAGPGSASQGPVSPSDRAGAPATLLTGYHFRSDPDATRVLADLLGCRVLGVELGDNRFYHLDTCLAPLDEKTAIWHPPAFDEYARRAIREVFADLIELEPVEALRFAANAVVVEKSVVINVGCPKLSTELTRRGYEVFSVDLGEFIKAGGAAKCLVLWLER
jgi:N-dimethylarginine dimethylaminohydrolase